MKKLLSLLGVLGLVLPPVTTVIACGQKGSADSTLQNIENHLTTTDLGIFERSPINDQILQRLSSLNPELIISEVFVVDDQNLNNKNNNIDVKVIDDSKVYHSKTVALTYKIEPVTTIDSVLTERDLGMFDSQPTIDELTKRLHQLNPDLDLKEVDLSLGENHTLIIKVKESSLLYKQGNIALNYQINPLLKLATVIQTTDLGTFYFQPTSEELLAKVKELNPDLDLDEVELEGDVVKAKLNSIKYHGQVILRFTIDLTVLLSTVFQITDLGTFDHEPNNKELLNRARELNSGLDIDQLYIEDNLVKVIKESRKYRGQVVINYLVEINNQQDIKEFITVTDLGGFLSEGVPSKQEFLQKIVKLNPMLIVEELFIKEILSSQVILGINPDSKVYFETEVIFSYHLLRDFQKDLADGYWLGFFKEKPTEQEALTQLQELNPNLQADEFEFIKSLENYVILQVKRGSKVYKWTNIPLMFNYLIDHREDLRNHLKTTDLGSFTFIPTSENVTNRVKQVNPLVYHSEIKVDLKGDNKAVIVPVKHSKNYFPTEIEVSYVIDLRKDLIIDIPKRNLGTFYSQPTNAELLAKLKQLNPNLKEEEVYIENDLVKVRFGSKVYYPEDRELKLRYETDLRVDLTIILTNFDLGTFTERPTSNLVLAKLKQLNPDLVVPEILVNIGPTFKVQLRVAYGSKFYFILEEPITFQLDVDLRVTLSSVVKKTNLGQFDVKPRDEELLARIASINPNISINQVRLISHENGQATLSVKPGSKVYFDDIDHEISFTYQAEFRTYIDYHLWEKQLGTFTGLPSEEELLTTIQQLNPKLVVSELNLVHFKNGILIYEVSEASTVYFPVNEVYFYYTLDLDFKVNQDYVTSFIDSTGDTGYLYRNEYTNINNRSVKDKWNYAQTIDFLEINLNQSYGYDSIDNFFKDYKIEFSYQWIGNVWNSTAKWSKTNDAGDGKDLDQDSWFKRIDVIDKNHFTDEEFTNESKLFPATAFSYYIGGLGSDYQAVAAVHTWIETDGLTLKFRGQVATIYTWSDQQTDDFAAYSTIQAQGIKIISKKAKK